MDKWAARSARSLPPCGGGLGWGVKHNSSMIRPPSLSLPHKGGGNAAALHRSPHNLPVQLLGNPVPHRGDRRDVIVRTNQNDGVGRAADPLPEPVAHVE